MLDLSTIILTYNEELHIRRCLENVCPISKKVYVIDSPSSDKTIEICKEFNNVEVVVHKYPGNQADQVNWVIDNVKFDTQWVLRIDADEYLSEELKQEIQSKLPSLDNNVNGVILRRYHYFGGKLMNFDDQALILRLFRNGKAFCEKRLMDEYMVLKEGTSVIFDNLFYDHNLSSITECCKKHINYAKREAYVYLKEKYSNEIQNGLGGNEVNARNKKSSYYRLPKYWRAFFYFIYRYLFRGAFLKGKEGFVYCFIQGWWYRTLVDSVISEIEKKCNNNPFLILNYLDNYEL